MVKVFVIIGLFLVIAGVPALYWCSLQTDQEQQKISLCKAKYSHQIDKYAQKLAGVSLVTADSNSANSPSQANSEKMTSAQRRQDQHERLLAEIDDLAESQKSAPPDADLLYGDDWRQKVAEYKDNKQFMATVRVASVTAVLAGGVLFAAAVVFLIVRIFIGGIRRIVKTPEKKDMQQKPHERARPMQEEKFTTSSVPVSNASTQPAKTAGPTAEEFRKQLMQQTESLKETADQLKTIAGTLQQRGGESDHAISKRLEKGLKSQAESFKHENDALKKLVEDIRKAVESQSGDLAKAIESSIISQVAAIRNETSRSQEITYALNQETARLYADGLHGIKEQIDELVKSAIASSALRKSDSDEACKKIEQSLDAHAQNLKKEIQPLKEISGTVEQILAETKNNKPLDNSETMQRYADELFAIKEQIGELAKAVSAETSGQITSAQVCEKFEQMLNGQTENLKNQVEPLKEIAGSLGEKLEQIQNSKPSDNADEQLRQETKIVRKVSEESLQKSDAIGKSIADLTEQVGAIREYASRQQQRLAKLQDGYDWNLIKNFCLRVIRCIDNLDDRIGELSASGASVEHLRAVREELVFVLESNGVEAFGAKVDSDYRGQENRLQVLNDRDETEDNNLIGKIAQVVRPGYQCRVTDEYTKIVRPAHVRLYGVTCLSDTAVRGG